MTYRTEVLSIIKNYICMRYYEGVGFSEEITTPFYFCIVKRKDFL